MDLGEPILNREEISIDERGNETVILTSKVPLRDEAGEVTGLLGIIVDITERKRIEVELKQAKETAESATRAKSAFIANISHELRTPLTLILGPVKQALESGDLSPDMRRLLERVQRNGSRLHNLVNDVLDFAKAEASGTVVRRELIDLVVASRELVDDMQPLARSRGLRLELVATAATLNASVDPRLFERILLNLVGNAIKFTGAGGQVRVSIDCEDDCVRLDVADNGIGIPRAVQSRLFQQFVQVDSSAQRPHEGTGLGLALVKQFSEAMGGTVALESEEGKGSLFTVRLPLMMDRGVDAPVPIGRRRTDASGDRGAPQPGASEGIATHAARSSTNAVATGERPRVLVADDNADMRAYIAETLANEFSLVMAEDGEAAWTRLQEQRIDAVLSDVMMPRLDGLALTTRIKADAALARIPIILVTARGGAEAATSGLDAGADDYLAKPFDADELRARLRAAIRMSRMQEELRELSHRAGMSSVVSGILHNLGNVLNGVHVSCGLLEQKLESSRATSVGKVAHLLAEHANDLGGFVTRDERARKLPAFMRLLADDLLRERAEMAKDLALLRESVDHVWRVVAQHREFASRTPFDEVFGARETVEAALRLSAASMEGRGIDLTCRLEELPLLRGDRHKVLQILVNLLANAVDALESSGRRDKSLTIGTERQNGHVRFIVSDNGVGIAPDIKEKLFSQGFTTKDDGLGLGLHSSALLARELGGELRCESDGVGRGATFLLELPIPKTT